MTAFVVVNERFSSDTVRLNDNGDSAIVSLTAALDMANERDLDLVLIAGNANPPVVRIMDFGKFKFEQDKKEKMQRKANRQNAVEVKEIQLRPVTDDNDIKVKAKKARGFLEDGDKVKVTINFRGREQSHVDMGFDVLQDFCSHLGEYKVESDARLNGKKLIAIYTAA